VTVPPRRIRLDLAYDGTDFAGWQFQPGQRTVQGEIEQALAELHGGQPVRVRGAGRTDSGVHASQQVADCEVRCRLNDAELEHALRRLLSRDVRPLRVATVPPHFHSRKDATSKTYHYLLDASRHGDPFVARYALHFPHRLDLELLRRALDLLPGRRDWTGFTASTCGKSHRVRTLADARLQATERELFCFTFTADGFLRYMVRNLVGTLLDVGCGRVPLARIAQILETRDRDLASATAAPHGLTLTRVRYAEDVPPHAPLLPLWPADGPRATSPPAEGR